MEPLLSIPLIINIPCICPIFHGLHGLQEDAKDLLERAECIGCQGHIDSSQVGMDADTGISGGF